MQKEIIQFIRKKDFIYIKDIGQGGCGKTVLLKDDIIDEYFVCKKYNPSIPKTNEELFKKFIQEIKLLNFLNHRNVVRIFNFFVYPERRMAFIIMEYIKGLNIEDYLKKEPEKLDDVFVQIIEGFSYLEQSNILHRDIRPYNLLVDENGFVKIIDFGFGKLIAFDTDYQKSITLNWWCDVPPEEFKKHIYDFTTEIYFVGKLLEKIIVEISIEHFSYKEVLGKMIKIKYNERIKSFQDIKRLILTNRKDEFDFNTAEKSFYLNFVNEFVNLFGEIETVAKYKTDIEQIIKQLEQIYKSCLLEDYILNNVVLLRCFVDGSYTYYKQNKLALDNLKNFIFLLKNNSKERQNIIMNNLWNRLDTIKRYNKSDNQNEGQYDDLPF